MADTTPSSLSEIVQAVQPVQPEPTTQPEPAAAAPETTADDTSSSEVTTPDDSGETTSTTDGTAADASAPPSSIDWGAAMPALAAKAREILGDDAAWITKQSDIDGLLRAMAEREKQVGQQSVYVGAFNQLAKAGVTTEDLNDLMTGNVQAILQRRGQPQQPASGGNGQAPAGWSKKFIAGRDAEGRPIFNRAELARAGITEAEAAQRYAAWQDQLADIFSGPEGIQSLIAGVVDPRLGYVADQTKQELTAAQQASLAQQRAAQAQAADEAAAQAWCNAHAKDLYANGKDVTGGVKPFFNQIQDYMKQLNPNMPWAQQLEMAAQHVLAVNRPAAGTPTPSDKAKRQPATGAQPVKLSPSQFHEKYGDRYAGLGMAEYLAYVSTGQVPAKQSA